MSLRKLPICGILFLLLLSSALNGVVAQELPASIRIATYNIEHFGGKPNGPNRINRLKTVIDKLNADVIGLQEIKDRAALRLIFPNDKWQILIDDDSNDTQDLAIAVRLPFKVAGAQSNDIDADNDDFLFPFDDAANDDAFPNNRDVLFARIGHPSTDKTFVMMVHHGKSRLGGRDNTDRRRQAATRLIVSKLETDFDGEHVIIVGDMNDNPDDVSMNILETGNSNAGPGPDDVGDDSFMVNLTQPLVALDHVSWGLNNSRIVAGKLETRVTGSRAQNNATRGTAGAEAPILFDQILVTRSAFERFTVKSILVFDDAAAQEGHSPGNNPGPGIDYASDHTPVVVEFGSAPPVGPPTIPVTPTPGIPVITPPPPPGVSPPIAKVRISEILPKPAGDNAGKETVTLKNFGGADVDLTGWRLVDKAGHELVLEGTVKKNNGVLVIKLKAGQVPLNNDGDELRLFDDNDVQIDKIKYVDSEVKTGKPIRFAG